MSDNPNHSLKKRLIWHILTFQVLLLVAVIAGFMALLIRADLGGMILDASSASIAASAVEVTPDQKLRLKNTPQLQALLAETPGFWFVVRNERGDTIQSGPVPDAYRGIGEHLDRVAFADIRDGLEPYLLSAIVRAIETENGTYTVLTGGGRLWSASFAVFFLTNLLLLPIVLILVLIPAFAIPIIVRRAFSSLAEVADHAKSIDVDRRGARLPDGRVPGEVRPLVEAVNGALQRLDEGYERRQRFILDAAHELRTPVAILQTRLEGMDIGPLRARLLVDTARIAGLAEQLLDLERIDRDGAHFAPLDLVSLCRDVAADLAPLALSADCDISFTHGPDQVSARGDAGALERAVTNLVRNAIEHAGGLISIHVERGGIIEVSDEGPGIPESERERIFEPFHRLQPRDHGAGLGLHLVSEIVNRHKGHISVVCAPTGGACFRMTLPVA
ncbi:MULTISPECIES: HAMP domain-containing sensor histidine kinase [unclassified Ensifer]|uniref:sensor histidine kinase n=1 Tax=unclassified Ensifer TaxID=2633371 RepID=UPI00070B87AA|nr:MULTISPECIES: HAMP domain-containing sensor histidine kinase [unclassified Ensifer]KQW61911.1 histidine kinase [Ensifer sp. Root1252]KRC83065.1 histidine kinase [Ensifer sp. Root231]KRC84938.1 histidine kinase [Ensifer sp. Root258]